MARSMRPCLLAALVLLSLCFSAPSALLLASAAPPPVVRIGALLPITGALSGQGNRAWLLLNQSLSDLRVKYPDLLPNTSLVLQVEDTGSTTLGTVAAAVRAASSGTTAIITGSQGLNSVSNQPASAVGSLTAGGLNVGPGSAEVAASAYMAAAMDISMTVTAVSASACARKEYEDKARFPNLVRMCQRGPAKSQAMLAAFKAFGWKKMAFFASDDADGVGRNAYTDDDSTGNYLGTGQAEVDFLIDDLMNQLTPEDQLTDLLRLRFPMRPSVAKALIPGYLTQLQDSGIRIVIVYVQGELLHELLHQAAERGMMQYPYVWVGGGSYAGDAASEGMGTGTVGSGGLGPGLCADATVAALADVTPAIPSTSSSDGRLITSYQSSTIGAQSSGAAYVYQADLAWSGSPLLGAICFVPSTPNTPELVNLKYVLEKQQGLPFDSILSPSDANVYDSITLHALAIDQLIRDGVAPVADHSYYGDLAAIFPPAALFAALREQRFDGLSGSVSFNDVGDRITRMDMLNYDPLGAQTGTFVRRAVWDEADGPSAAFNFTEQIIWPDGSIDLPPDHVNKFEEGQTISPSYASEIVVLSFLYALLPSALLVYNARKLTRSFVEAQPGDRSWVMDAVQAFFFFGVSGYFPVHHLNILAADWSGTGLGSLTLTNEAFAGSLLMSLMLVLILCPVPLLVEAWWNARKGAAEQLAVAELFSLHMENGVEVQVETADAKAAGAKDKDGEGKKLKPSNKEKLRASRARARKGLLTTNDEAGFWAEELAFMQEKTTPGMLLMCGLLSAVYVAQYYISIEGYVLPLKPSISSQNAFGVWLLGLVLFHWILTHVFMDSRNVRRALCVPTLAAVLLCMEVACRSTVTWHYASDGTPSSPGGTVDMSGVAIAMAVLFAIPFFCGLLQLIKALKLSRHSLDSILIGMKIKLAHLEVALETAKAERKAQQADTDHLKRLLELANLCRPLHRNHALAFTMADYTTGGPDSAADKKPFVPASFTQDAPVVRNTAAARAASTGIGSSAPGTPKQSMGIGGREFRSPVSPSAERSAVGISTVRLLPEGSVPPSPAPFRKNMQASTAAAAAERANLSQGILAANLSSMDFGFLSRAKSEKVGNTLLNELTLELFLASGPVHHRAVADITLTHVLSHPITLELFKDSLVRAGTQECMALWLDIQRYKQLDGEEARRLVGDQIAQAFLYSDATYPSTSKFITEKARMGVVDALLSRRSMRRGLFAAVEADVLKLLEKEHANSFASSTSFKVCAFLLGHSSYRPSTRIKTLNVGGAAVGEGGALVPMTQIAGSEMSNSGATAAPTFGGAAGAGGAFGPESSIGTGLGFGGRSHLGVDMKVVKGTSPSPAAGAGRGLQKPAVKGASAGASPIPPPSPSAGTPVIVVDSDGLKSPSHGAGIAVPPSPQRSSSLVGGADSEAAGTIELGGLSVGATPAISAATTPAVGAAASPAAAPAAEEEGAGAFALLSVPTAGAEAGAAAEAAAAAAGDAAEAEDADDENKPLSPSTNES